MSASQPHSVSASLCLTRRHCFKKSGSRCLFESPGVRGWCRVLVTTVLILVLASTRADAHAGVVHPGEPPVTDGPAAPARLRPGNTLSDAVVDHNALLPSGTPRNDRVDSPSAFNSIALFPAGQTVDPTVDPALEQAVASSTVTVHADANLEGRTTTTTTTTTPATHLLDLATGARQQPQAGLTSPPAGALPAGGGVINTPVAHPEGHHGVVPTPHQTPHLNPCRPGHQRPPRCETTLNGTRMDIFCSGGVLKVSRSRSPKAKTSNVVLMLCFWPEGPFDPIKLTNFPRLQRLLVVESNITEMLDFPYHDHLEELILADLRLTWLGDDAFAGLRRLRLLDLSRNQLSVLSGATLLRLPSLRRLLLAGNPWRCTLALSWMTELAARRVTLADEEAMLCGAALFPRRPVLTVVALLKRVSAECPVDSACACELSRVVRDVRDVRDGVHAHRDELVPIITVNCSHRSLATMPHRLPANTTTLLLRGNQITSVRPLVDRHEGVLDVYLDNNMVESIADLEGSPWLANFRVLSLRANKLQQLPTYALDNALERNVHAVRVYLGLNPWRCDCQFMPTFQELLAKYKSLIADWDDIRCAEVDGDDNSMKKIHGLSRSAVCREEPQVSALDVVNAILGVSLVLVLAKLAFDFWQYRRYGRLPWIATKLP